MMTGGAVPWLAHGALRRRGPTLRDAWRHIWRVHARADQRARIARARASVSSPNGEGGQSGLASHLRAKLPREGNGRPRAIDLDAGADWVSIGQAGRRTSRGRKIHVLPTFFRTGVGSARARDFRVRERSAQQG